MKEIIKFSKTLKVLFCEDDKIVRDTIEKLFRRFFDDIDIAIDGEDGLQKFKSKKYDIVITDINMPNMDGLEMLKYIKEIDSSVSCIILSAHNEINHFMKSIKLGVDGYIIKPIAMEQFLDVLNKVINKIKLEHDNIIYKNDLEQLNKNLQIEVDSAVEDIRIKDALLSQNSKMAAMGEMIDSIAHQWMQPINTIGITLQSLGIELEYGTLTDQKIKELIEKGNLQIEHLVNTIEEFRAFFRPNSKVELIPLKAIIDSSLLLLKDILIKNNIQIEIIGDTTATIKVNPSEFKHIIINILNNAKDAFNNQNIDKENRQIKFEINKESNNIILLIEDNAGGIPVDIINRIFEPYFTTKNPDKGTGIGLYMVKQIAQKNHTDISVSNIQNGACFKINTGDIG